jgi:hypothetical protein
LPEICLIWVHVMETLEVLFSVKSKDIIITTICHKFVMFLLVFPIITIGLSLKYNIILKLIINY